jgi:hypothetical protein
VFAPVAGVVFPEFSLYFRTFGYAGRPEIAHVWDSFTGFLLGWYRPVSFTLAPFLFGVDLLNPPSVIVLNIAFFALAAYLLPALFIPQAALPVKLLASSLILTAPALQSVSYFAVIDSLYIILAAVTIIVLEKAYQERGAARVLLYLAAGLLLLLTAAAKEVGVLTPFVAATVLFLRRITMGGDRPSWRLAVDILKFCAPLMLVSILYYAVYIFLRGAFVSADSYSSVATLEKIYGIPQFLKVSLNLGFPTDESWWVRWATAGYDQIASMTRLGVYAVALLLVIGQIFARGPWPAVAFLAVLLTMAVPLGIFHVHPHHTYPLVAALALGIAAAFCFMERWTVGRWVVAGKYLVVSLHALLLGVSFLLMFRAYEYNRQVYTSGIHGPQLSYNTKLFYDSAFKALVQQRPTYLLIEQCPDDWAVGSKAGVLHYYGRADNALGEEYVPLGDLTAAAAKRRDAVEAQGGQLLALECDRAGFRAYRIRDFAEAPIALVLGRDYGVSTHPDLFGRALLGAGWSQLEAGYVWSDSDVARLNLPIPPQARTVHFDLAAFAPGDLTQTLAIEADAVVGIRAEFDARNSRRVLSMPLPDNVAGTLEVRFRIGKPISPKELSLSTDVRRLGVALYGIRFE